MILTAYGLPNLTPVCFPSWLLGDGHVRRPSRWLLVSRVRPGDGSWLLPALLTLFKGNPYDHDYFHS